MLIAPVLALVVVPQVAQVEAVLERELGSPDGGLEQVFGWVSDVAADSEGTVYVLDQRADRVRVFSRTGGYLSTFGRRGRNPGELNRPVAIDVRGETVTVLNPSSQVNVYGPNGRLLASERVPFGAQSVVRIADGAYAVLSEGGVARQNPEPIESLLLVGPGDASDTVLTVPSRDLLYRAPTAISSIGTSLCGLAHFVVGADGTLWVASGVDGTLTEWRIVDGAWRRGRSADVAPAAGPLPDSLRAQVLEQLPSQIDPESEYLYVPSLLSSICGLELATDDTLWMRLSDVDGRERWSAIDVESASPTEELTIPAGVAVSAFSVGRAIGIRVDDTGVPHVGIYRIE